MVSHIKEERDTFPRTVAFGEIPKMEIPCPTLIVNGPHIIKPPT